ncbi:tetratricopeptide repeat protein [Zavarzinella formosa]|uniref:tetratricopeptide repeat protein n=1 Tax=Zavarzinella formosa TaxID=360055 RepID=UPI00030652B8|nr:tetratricopeptide repeat protein [Zavarzinella formosa]
MLIRRISLVAALVAIFGVVWAQTPAPTPADKDKKAPPADTGELDPISKQAAVIEADLAKTSSTSKEAAELMLKLIDLYHNNGRPFGLVRVAQTFVGIHTTHPRHKEVMLKLIDGLQTTGRSKELIATGRQFLSRHPTDPACADIERWLSLMLRKTNDNVNAAAVLESHWKRLGVSGDGPQAGSDAINIYMAINNPESLAKAGLLAEDMLDKLPAGVASQSAGWRAVDAQERLSAWAKANLVATKLLAKSPPTIPYYLQYLHHRMAENYSRLGQRTNAVESWKKALAVAGNPPRPDLHMRLIEELVQTNPKPGEFEPTVNEYVTKYPDRTDRFAARIRLASVYANAKDFARAEQILTEVLPFDARSHSASSAYVQLFGAEMDMNARNARLAKAEAVLRDAIAKSTPANAGVLRYSLALELLRDRTKDIPKAKAAARELAFVFPANDNYTSGAVNWLLDSAADDAEFNADVARTVEARRKFPWIGTYQGTLAGWAQARLPNKDLAARAKAVQAEVAKSDKEPVNAEWLAYETAAAQNVWSPQTAAARTKLVDPARLAAYPDDVANNLLYGHHYYLRHYSPDNQRLKSIDAAKAWTVRMPKSFDAAYTYLTTTTDFNKPETFRDAATVILNLEPNALSTDSSRRLLPIAAHFKDVAMGRQIWAWTKKMFEKYGYDNYSATTMGDSMSALEMKAEAKECWERSLTGNPDSQDYVQSAYRLVALQPETEKPKFLDAMLAKETGWQFSFAVSRADYMVKAGDVDGTIKLLTSAAEKTRNRAFGVSSLDNEWNTLFNWVGAYRADPKALPANQVKLYTFIRDLRVVRASMVAQVALLEIPEESAKLPPMKRLFLLAEASQLGVGDASDFDMLTPYVQAAMGRKDYLSAATLMSGMLGHLPGIDDSRRKSGRELLSQAYSRLGAAGGAVIDEKSPIAPLLAAGLQLRLGDQKLAFETYLANQKLFDEHRTEVPVDLIVFVCENHIAAGGDDNLNRVEDILRAWLIKNAEIKEIDEVEKARIQLLLARNYFRAKRYDLARAEFTTLHNRYPKTPQAVEADFGIGETFMEQKVYDQAEQAFERLAGSRERDVVIRAEFLRGVLASRRGDRDEARLIFRSVLERVPNIELANQALFNLSEVYGAEQRYVDQLELLRTVGRLGRASKRYHTPGEPLSIVVQDSDLGVSRGHSRIPVRVTTEPGGDEETIFLISGGGGKGLFRADLETRLGNSTKNDRVLQLTGKDTIRVDYPPEFKKEFKDAPLPDTEIRISADGKLEISSGKIVDEDEETFSKALAREANPENEQERKGLVRPKDQVKPGNVIYIRVKDADRDWTNQPDKISVKLTATSGDQVSVQLTETGPHTGIFEGTAKSGELPVGALATNTAIDHSPLMAIDKDKKTAWLSEPDGATPKVLSIDMKNLKRTDRVTVSTPDAKQNAPIRMTLEGSDDGRLWFRLASTHPDPKIAPVAGDYGPMTARIYVGTNATGFTTWDQVVALTKNTKATTEGKAADLFWTRQPDDKAKQPTAIVWHGKVVQPKAGAVRFAISGEATAILVDGRLELPFGKNRLADVYLDAGTHDVTIFTAAGPNTATLEARWASGETTTAEIEPVPFREADFDLARPEAKTAATPRLLGDGTMDKEGTSWDFKFPAIGLRHVRTVIQEYRGEAVAINNVEIRDSEKNVLHIPTEADLLSLATNDILEIGGGDVVTATYIDDLNLTGSSRLLDAKLTATYHNAVITPIGYDFFRYPNGQVVNLRKEVLRIDPGERVIIEVVDFDQDTTSGRDKIKVQVSVNDGPPVTMEADETQENSGIFTKEVDTAAAAAEGKIVVKAGDRLLLRYLDEQNTIPGHAAIRETVVYVNEPTPGRVRVIETRITKPPIGAPADEAPQIRYKPAVAGGVVDPKVIAGVAFEAPFTVEVIDRDAAKDSRSKVTVKLKTTAGATVEVECVLDDRRLGTESLDKYGTALQEGRFTGQVVMQLGGKESLALVPLTASMPRDLIGGPKLPKDDMEEGNNRDKAIVTMVLNLNGSDIVEATYADAQRPGGATNLTASARLLTDGKLTVTDAEYQKDVTAVHVGERLYLKVVDADLDRTENRDKAKVRIRTKRGEDETVELEETLAHSGVFTGSVMLKPVEKPTVGNLKQETPEIECYFGDTIEVMYVDEQSSSSEGRVELIVPVAVVIGTDGKVQAFSKLFSDEALAVETQFHVAESHFELFKSHKALNREAEARADLEAGRRVLREVIEDYPNPKYTPRVSYLLGQFAQELKQYKEATQAYQTIVKQFPDHTLAPDAQFKLAQCYEEAGEFNQALEAYVTLAATYPKHPLIANVMVRISEHFYKLENYKVVAQVGEKFLERFEGHKWAPKMAFRVGQCYYKDKQYTKAAETFDKFVTTFREDALCPDAMFWSGESYRTAGNMRKAFQSYNKCRWDYPASEVAKYARGRLALPEMLRQFEEASNLDGKN